MLVLEYFFCNYVLNTAVGVSKYLLMRGYVRNLIFIVRILIVELGEESFIDINQL